MDYIIRFEPVDYYYIIILWYLLNDKFTKKIGMKYTINNNAKNISIIIS